jgi:hypothetical protein
MTPNLKSLYTFLHCAYLHVSLSSKMSNGVHGFLALTLGMAVSLCTLEPNSTHVSVATCMREAQPSNPLTLFIILRSALAQASSGFNETEAVPFRHWFEPNNRSHDNKELTRQSCHEDR